MGHQPKAGGKQIVIFLVLLITVFAQIQAAAFIFSNNNKCGLYSSAASI
jgi:hypothetical protein